jgi:hypothetical protein
VWRDTGSPARQLDLPAHELPRVVLDAMQQKWVIDRRGAAELVPNC